jgi:hypothetical protein
MGATRHVIKAEACDIDATWMRKAGNESRCDTARELRSSQHAYVRTRRDTVSMACQRPARHPGLPHGPRARIVVVPTRVVHDRSAGRRMELPDRVVRLVDLLRVIDRLGAIGHLRRRQPT